MNIDVYWRDDDLGRGPAASLFVHGCEAVRLDCFGGDQGHLHLWLDGKVGRRWYFPPAPATEHVERAAFELARNHAMLLGVCRDPRLEGVKLQSARMEAAAQAAREALLSLLRERAVSN
ncbi:MAG: hypothetical protein NVS9B1_19900 [Candidatus Dormibacteraceae bacterium]